MLRDPPSEISLQDAAVGLTFRRYPFRITLLISNLWDFRQQKRENLDRNQFRILQNLFFKSRAGSNSLKEAGRDDLFF